MKKWIALLLAAVMCLSFCACGGNASDGKQTETGFGDHSETLKKFAAVKKSVAILQFSMGPEFEIYLDPDNTVLSVSYTNNAAKEALRDVDVVGRDGLDAVFFLLTAIFEGNSVKDDVTITVTPIRKADNAAAEAVAKEISPLVAQMKTEMALPFSVSVAMQDWILVGSKA